MDRRYIVKSAVTYASQKHVKANLFNPITDYQFDYMVMRIRKLFAFLSLLLFIGTSIFFVVQVTSGGGSENGDIGWELLANNTVLRIWNKYDSYYFNVSNGMQITNHYQEYWSHNVFMLGYYTGGNWNLIYRTDELSGFNKNLDTDNAMYINATLWKDLSYKLKGKTYDFRLALRYCLGINDSELTVIPYIKNLGIAIPVDLGLGWEIKDIQVCMTPENDFIEINSTSFLLNQTLDISYTNLHEAEFFIEERVSEVTEVLSLKWNNSLTYKVRIQSRTGQYNAPVTLGIKVGTLGVGQEKFTKLLWHDASTVNLIPGAEGTTQQWSVFPGGLPVIHWNKVDDPPLNPPDEDTTYVYTATTSKIEDFNHETSSLLIGATIRNVRLLVRARKTTAVSTGIALGLRIAGTRYDSGFMQTVTTSYVDYVWDWANNPATASAWTKTVIDDLQSSMQSGMAAGTNQLRMTQVYFIVTYTPNKPPELTDPSVYPTDGIEEYTFFQFNVRWVDADGDDPTDGYLKVNVSRAGWSVNTSMTWISGSNTTGARYQYTTQLEEGRYRYKFWAYDGKNYNNTGRDGPNVNALVIEFDINISSFGFGIVLANAYKYSNQTNAQYTMKIYNNGSVAIDIDVNGTNATATGVSAWVLEATNGNNRYTMELYNSTTGWWKLALAKSTWYSNMLVGNIRANLRVKTPTAFYSGKQMSCHIYMWASIH